MPRSTAFSRVLDKYRAHSISELDKGNKFELLMQRFLLADPVFSPIDYLIMPARNLILLLFLLLILIAAESVVRRREARHL